MTPSRLKEIRESMALTQGGLAALLGMSRDAIARMESGDRPIELRTLLAMAAINARLPPLE